MKRLLASTFLAGLLTGTALAQPSDTYINYGEVRVPPQSPSLLQIDAINFINEGPFVWVSTNLTLNSQLWEPSNTRTYLNNNSMIGMPGFRFDRAPSGTGVRAPSDSFINNGSISVNTSDAFNFGFLFRGFLNEMAQLRVYATNIYSPGTISLGFESIATLSGGNVDLNGGSVVMDTIGTNVLSNFLFFNQGFVDGYWGVGTNSNPATFFNNNPPTTPLHEVTNWNYYITDERITAANGLAYYNEELDASGSNRLIRAVFVANTNADVNLSVYFPPAAFGFFLGDIIVEWELLSRNQLGVTTNYMYLGDAFGANTNFFVNLNGGFTSTFLTYIPDNYTFFFNSFFGFGPRATPMIIPNGALDSAGVPAQYSAYQAQFTATSEPLNRVVGQDVTNSPGRIEIIANKYLDLTDSTITSGGYMSLQGTNHFGGSARAAISSPWFDINLRITNGTFAVTNLLRPTVPKREGTVELFSSRWTNNVAGISNSYHVLFVQSLLVSEAPSRIQDLTLRVTNTLGGDDNLIINDTLNVSRKLLLDASRITISTNDTDALLKTGAINFLGSSIIWPNATPRLQYFTNQGTIFAANAMFFGGQRSSPYYTSNFTQPYWEFINLGSISNSATIISATNVVSLGTVSASTGNVELRDNLGALLTNGGFYASLGAVRLSSASMTASNFMLAGNSLSLTITNLLDDGSLAGSVETLTNKNTWYVGAGGLSYTRAATQASLLGTTISVTTPTVGQRVPIKWAAQDRQATTNGFARNAAVGRLILDGATNTQFQFIGATAGSAIYIDRLELLNFTAHRLPGNFSGLSADANIKVYFGDAWADGLSVAQKLDGKDGGRFVWVTNYTTGFYSSTNLIYPDGTTNRLNIALRTSCDMDSDNDGIVNCDDPDPVQIGPALTPASLSLTVRYEAQPSPQAVVSWKTVPYSMNYLLTAPSLASTNWTTVTNFVQGTSGGWVTIPDPIKANAATRYYRVRVDGPSQ
jgi:hypothetical protein